MTNTEHVIRAAKNYNAWGRPMSARYVEKRGIPRHLLTLAVQLDRSKEWA